MSETGTAPASAETPFGLPATLWTWIQPVLEDPELGGAAQLCLDDTPPDVPALAAQLKESPDPRLSALLLLKLSSMAHPKIVGVLSRFSAHNRPELRWTATEALARMGIPEAIEACLPSLDDSDPALRAAAVETLQRQDDLVMDKALQLALGSQEAKRRELGARALAVLRRQGYELALIRMLKDPNAQVQRLALELIRDHATPECIPLLDDLSIEFEDSPLEAELDRTIEILQARDGAAPASEPPPVGSAPPEEVERTALDSLPPQPSSPPPLGAAEAEEEEDEEDPFLAIERMKRSIAKQQEELLKQKEEEEAVQAAAMESDTEMLEADPLAGLGNVEDAFDSSQDFVQSGIQDAPADADSGSSAADGLLGEEPAAVEPEADAAPEPIPGLEEDPLAGAELDPLAGLQATPAPEPEEGPPPVGEEPGLQTAPPVGAVASEDEAPAEAPGEPGLDADPLAALTDGVGDALDALAVAAPISRPPPSPDDPGSPREPAPEVATTPPEERASADADSIEIAAPLEAPTPTPPASASAPAAATGAGAAAAAAIAAASAASGEEEQAGPSRDWITRLVRDLIQRGGSDLHLQAGCSPRYRVDGKLVDVGGLIVDQNQLTVGLRDLAGDRFPDFIEDGDTDFAYSVRDVGRFRCTLFLQGGHPAASFRVVPGRIPTVADIGLPDLVCDLARKPAGLLLLTSPGASGKSTTLASLVDHLNRTHGGHILTVEDPVEYLHSDAAGSVTQREVGSDTRSFEAAARAAERQDIDCLALGAVDRPGILQAALDLAGAGRLVIACVTAATVEQTLDTLLGMFDTEERPRIRDALASTLLGIVSQALLPRVGGGRVAAFEILTNTPEVAERLHRVGASGIRRTMAAAADAGMFTLEWALADLVQRGLVTREEAILRAAQPQDLSALLGGGEG